MILWFTAKPRAAKMIRTIEKMNKILKYYRKYRNYLIFRVKLFSFNHTLWLHEEINLLISCWVIFHSSWRAFHNYSVVLGFLALERSPRVFHTFSIGLRSGLWGGQSITVTFSVLNAERRPYFSRELLNLTSDTIAKQWQQLWQ